MKVIIADPQPKVRHALSIWISGLPGWEIIGEATNSSDLLNLMGRLSPEVVILDRELPGLPVEEMIKQVRQTSKEATAILLIGPPLERCQKEALDVDFYVSKVDPPNHMLDAILKAERWLERKAG